MAFTAHPTQKPHRKSSSARVSKDDFSVFIVVTLPGRPPNLNHSSHMEDLRLLFLRQGVSTQPSGCPVCPPNPHINHRGENVGVLANIRVWHSGKDSLGDHKPAKVEKAYGAILDGSHPGRIRRLGQ